MEYTYYVVYKYVSSITGDSGIASIDVNMPHAIDTIDKINRISDLLKAKFGLSQVIILNFIKLG